VSLGLKLLCPDCGRRLAGLGHKPSKLAIPGSNPGDRTFVLCDDYPLPFIYVELRREMPDQASSSFCFWRNNVIEVG
jgi:hypothetical protein